MTSTGVTECRQFFMQVDARRCCHIAVRIKLPYAETQRSDVSASVAQQLHALSDEK